MRPQLAPPQYKSHTVKVNGINSDIVTTLNGAFNNAVKETRGFVVDGTPLEKVFSIWDYIQKSVKYKKDSLGSQVIQMPSRMFLDTRSGDCKSMALAAAAIMANNGFDNVRLRYTSYEKNDPTPTHVYAVGKIGGKEFIIDPVYSRFNAELPYKSKKDYPMNISVLSGAPASARIMVRQTSEVKAPNLKNLITKVKPGGVFYNVIANKLGRDSGKVTFMRYEAPQLAKYKKMLEHRLNVKNPTLRSLVAEELRMINTGTFTGNITQNYSSDISGLNEEIGRLSLKKIGKSIRKAVKDTGKFIKKANPVVLIRGLKTVGLVVPRKAFLTLVNINARGLASRLAKVSQDKLRKAWVDRLGGKMSVLNTAIRRGQTKKAILGINEKIVAIKGVGYLVDERIGVSPASGADAAGGGAGAGSGVNVAELVKVAGPIIDFILGLLKSLGSKSDEKGGDFEETKGSSENAFSDYWEKGLDIAENLGIIPDRNLSASEQNVDNAIPGDDHTDMEETGFQITPAIGVGILAGLYLLFKK